MPVSQADLNIVISSTMWFLQYSHQNHLTKVLFLCIGKALRDGIFKAVLAWRDEFSPLCKRVARTSVVVISGLRLALHVLFMRLERHDCCLTS